MRSIAHDIEYQGGADRVFRVVPLSDVHWGHRDCDETAFRETVAYIRDTPDTYWFGVGDMLDAVGRNNGDKRSQESALAPWLHGRDDILDTQRDSFWGEIQEIAPTCLAWVMGNHERSALAHQGIDLYWRVAERIAASQPGRPRLALGVHGFIRMRFRTKSEGERVRGRGRGGLHSFPFTIYTHHGFGGGRKAGGKALKLQALAETYDADAYVIGHVHGEQNLRGRRIRLTQHDTIQQRDWVATIAGCYLNGTPAQDPIDAWDPAAKIPPVFPADNYAETAGYPPSPIGSPELIIRPYDCRVRVATSW